MLLYYVINYIFTCIDYWKKNPKLNNKLNSCMAIRD